MYIGLQRELEGYYFKDTVFYRLGFAMQRGHGIAIAGMIHGLS